MLYAPLVFTFSATDSPWLTLCAVANPSMPLGFCTCQYCVPSRQFSAATGFADVHDRAGTVADATRESPDSLPATARTA
jgi:hypothetical protein